MGRTTRAPVGQVIANKQPLERKMMGLTVLPELLVGKDRVGKREFYGTRVSSLATPVHSSIQKRRWRKHIS
jgi:hypothetical protein